MKTTRRGALLIRNSHTKNGPICSSSCRPIKRSAHQTCRLGEMLITATFAQSSVLSNQLYSHGYHFYTMFHDSIKRMCSGHSLLCSHAFISVSKGFLNVKKRSTNYILICRGSFRTCWALRRQNEVILWKMALWSNKQQFTMPGSLNNKKTSKWYRLDVLVLRLRMGTAWGIASDTRPCTPSLS